MKPLSIVILCFAAITVYAPQAWADAAMAQGAKPLSDWQLTMSAPTVKTEIAALVIQGKRPTDKIYVPDLDILITRENKRLIPLLRFLRLIEANGELRNDMIIFAIENGKLTPLDLLNKTLQVGDEKIPIDVEVGVSDITNNTEIYVSEEVLKQAFGFDFVWDPERVEYRITTDRELEIFKRRRLKVVPVSLSDIKKMTESLPETEPPARPKPRKPLMSFIQTESRTDVGRQFSQGSASYDLGEAPAITAWGSVFKGDYKIRLNRSLTYPYSYPYQEAKSSVFSLSSWIDQGLWTSKSENLKVNVGDTNMGLSDLVGPAVRLLGATFKWLPKAAGNRELRDCFFKMSRPSFLSDEKFEGYALLGSTVELWINNRMVESKAVEEFDGAPAGYGYYRFDGIDLLLNSVNEAKIVIKRPDGIIEESRKEVLSVNQLLPAGQIAFMGGIGTDKKKVGAETTLKGGFAGIQALYGFSKDITLGLTAAGQDKFAILRDETSGEYYDVPRLYYLAQEGRWRAFDRLFARYNVGVNYDPYDGLRAYAATADFEYHFKKAKLTSKLFSYDTGYSDGVNAISDRRGFYLSADWNVLKNIFLQGGILHIFNNLKGALDLTRNEDLMTAQAQICDVIPRSTLRLEAGRLARSGGIYNNAAGGDTCGAELTSAITDKLDLSVYYSIGNRINTYSMDSLSYGLPLPNTDSFYSYNKKIKASYKLTPSHAVSAAYYGQSLGDRVEFSSNYNNKGKYRWRSRLDIGGDLKRSKYYWRENLEFDIDKNGENRAGVRVGFNEAESAYDVSFYVKIKNMFAFKDGGIDNVSGLRISPERGGIQGTVYLDLNGNGHRELGEPGVPDVAVLLDDKECTESGKHGSFYIPRRENKDLVTVSLDMNILSAVYTPTQGVQRAYWEEGSFTSVNLGVCVLGSASGTVKMLEGGNFVKNIAEVRVLLIPAGKEEPVKDSITAYDGSFYIGQIKPGDYVLKIDTATIPEGYELISAGSDKITVVAGREVAEIENCDIDLNLKKVEPPKEPEETSDDKAKIGEGTLRQYQLTDKIIEVEEKLLSERIWTTLIYIYEKMGFVKHDVYKTNAVNVAL